MNGPKFFSVLLHIFMYVCKCVRAGQTAQGDGAVVAKLDSLNSIPRTHMVEERTNSQKLPSDLHTHACVHSYTPTPLHSPLLNVN